MLDLFRRQVDLLLERNAHVHAGLDPSKFRNLLEPLTSQLDRIPEEDRRSEAPFVICLGTGLVSLENQMKLVRVNDKLGSMNISGEKAVLNPDFVNGHPFPYLAVGVQMGDRRKRARSNVDRRVHRDMLRAVEAVAIGIHFPNLIPLDREVEILGSGYEHNERMMMIGIRTSRYEKWNRSLCLSWSTHEKQFHYGATCQSRIFLPGYAPEQLNHLDSSLMASYPERYLTQPADL